MASSSRSGGPQRGCAAWLTNHHEEGRQQMQSPPSCLKAASAGDTQNGGVSQNVDRRPKLKPKSSVSLIEMVLLFFEASTFSVGEKP